MIDRCPSIDTMRKRMNTRLQFVKSAVTSANFQGGVWPTRKSKGILLREGTNPRFLVIGLTLCISRGEKHG